MMASFLAVAEIAAGLPFLKQILLKKLVRWLSFKFPTTLAACRRAILSRLLPLGVWLLSTLPPETFLLGDRRNQEANCLAVSNCFIPSGPISLINVNTVAWLNPWMASKSMPSKY